MDISRRYSNRMTKVTCRAFGFKYHGELIEKNDSEIVIRDERTGMKIRLPLDKTIIEEDNG